MISGDARLFRRIVVTGRWMIVMGCCAVAMGALAVCVTAILHDDVPEAKSAAIQAMREHTLDMMCAAAVVYVATGFLHFFFRSKLLRVRTPCATGCLVLSIVDFALFGYALFNIVRSAVPSPIGLGIILLCLLGSIITFIYALLAMEALKRLQTGHTGGRRGFLPIPVRETSSSSRGRY